MALDPSVIIPPPPQQINPLQIVSQVQNYRNAQAQNLLLQTEGQRAQQQLGSDNAIGAAVQQSTDPTTGDVDYGSVNRIVANTPSAALGAQASAGNSTQQQRQQTQLSMERLESFQKHFSAVSDAITPVLANPGATKKDVVTAATGLVSNPDLDPDSKSDLIKNAVSLVGSIPDSATPAMIHQKLQAIALQAAGNQTQIANLIGQNATIDNGPTIAVGRQSPINGFHQTSVVNKGLTPGEAVQPVAGPVNPDGSQTTTPLGARAGMGTVTTGLGPTAQAEAASAGNVTGAGNANRAQAIQEEGLSATRRIAAASDVRAEIADVPDTAFGPSGQLTAKIGKLAAAFGISPPSAVNGQASLDAIGKSLAMISAAQAASYGAGTDASREMVHQATPSLDNSREGLMRNLAQVQGNDQWATARNQALQLAQQKGLSPTRTPQFETAFAREVSPTVFQYHLMDPTAQQQFVKSLNPAQAAALKAGTAKAQQYGWFGDE